MPFMGLLTLPLTRLGSSWIGRTSVTGHWPALIRSSGAFSGTGPVALDS